MAYLASASACGTASAMRTTSLPRVDFVKKSSPCLATDSLVFSFSVRRTSREAAMASPTRAKFTMYTSAPSGSHAIIVAGNPASPDVTQLTSPKVSPGRSGSFDAGVSPSLLTSRHDPFAITNNAPPSAFSGSPCFATATPDASVLTTASSSIPAKIARRAGVASAPVRASAFCAFSATVKSSSAVGTSVSSGMSSSSSKSSSAYSSAADPERDPSSAASRRPDAAESGSGRGVDARDSGSGDAGRDSGSGDAGTEDGAGDAGADSRGGEAG
eukprot:6270-Pelagococcus_subviridis.AAC.6